MWGLCERKKKNIFSASVSHFNRNLNSAAAVVFKDSLLSSQTDGETSSLSALFVSLRLLHIWNIWVFKEPLSITVSVEGTTKKMTASIHRGLNPLHPPPPSSTPCPWRFTSAANLNLCGQFQTHHALVCFGVTDESLLNMALTGWWLRAVITEKHRFQLFSQLLIQQRSYLALQYENKPLNWKLQKEKSIPLQPLRVFSWIYGSDFIWFMLNYSSDLHFLLKKSFL